MNRADGLPHSPSAERNKVAIGDALEGFLRSATTVLELGSGTGQHAMYLCERYSHLQWLPTEQQQHIEALGNAITAAGVKGILPPVVLAMDASAHANTLLNDIPKTNFSFAYSANTAHIMSIDEVAVMFQVVAAKLDSAGLFALYGPFKIDGCHTSDGNSEFDLMLREQQPHMGVRDKGELEVLANAVGLVLQEDIAMPANNRVLMWQRAS